MIATPTAAQWIELPVAPNPPSLGEDTYAASLAEELEAEIDALVQEDAISQAKRNVRRLAHALLVATSDDAEQESSLIVRGMMLYKQREVIDGSIDRISRLQSGDRAVIVSDGPSVASLLAEFNETVERDFIAGQSLQADEILAMLSPLHTALGDVAGWQGLPTMPDFEGLADRARVDEELHTMVAEVARYFERGWEFADLRPRIVRLHALFTEALSYLAAVTDATWLREDERSACFDRLRSAVRTFRDPEGRSQSEPMLRGLIAEAKLLASITAAAQFRNHRLDVNPLRAAISRAHRTWGSEANSPNYNRLVERFNWLAAVVDRMNRFRAMDRDETPLELRRIRTQLVDEYVATEQSLIRAAESLVLQPRGAVENPELASLLAQQRRLLDDLSRLQNLSRLVDAITLIRPASAAAFEEQVKQLASMLGHQIHRVDAAYALDRLESEVSRFWPMPFEDELRVQSTAAERVTGGRHLELLAAVDAQREDWARELGERAAVAARSAAPRLEATHRLLAIMADLSTLMRSQSGLAGQLLPSQLVSAEIDRLLPALQRATAAAIEGAEPNLLREVLALEHLSAITRLLSRVIADPENRSDINIAYAIVCRYAAESMYAKWAGRVDESEELWRYASRVATIALNQS